MRFLKQYIGDRPFYRRVFAVMLPVLAQNVITNFVSLLDNLMVGQVGTEAMSGVAIVNQLLFVFNLCIFGGLAGPGIFTAQFFGKGDQDGVRYMVRLKHLIALVVVALFGTVLILFGQPLISLFLYEGEAGIDLYETLAFGQQYLWIMLLGMVPFAWMQVYGSTLRECGETVLPMKAGLIAVFVNLILNYVLIFGRLGIPALGIRGAAIATVIARVVECSIVVGYAHRHKAEHPYIRNLYRSLRIPGKLMRRVIAKGTPLLLNELLWSAGMTTLNQCYSVRGVEVVSAVNIAMTVADLFFCAFMAVGTTISILIGQRLGAGEPEEAVDEDRKLLAFAVVLSASVGAIMAALAPLIPHLYNTEDAVKSLATSFLLVISLAMPFSAYTCGSYFTLRSGGKTIITFLFDCMFEWTVKVPIAMALAYGTDLPILGIFIAVQCSDLIKVVIGAILLHRRTWVNNLVENV